MLFFIREHQHSFSSNKLCVEDMREIDIVVKMGDRPSSACKKHRVFFDKTLHQMLGPAKILDQLGSMVKNIEEENTPGCGTLPDHFDIFPKGLIIVGGIDRGISITFDIIVKWHFFLAYQFLKIVPVP